MGRFVWLGVLGALAASGAWSAESPPGVLQDYQARLEEIAKEIQGIRREVEVLVNEVVTGESTLVYIFIKGPAPRFRAAGASLSIGRRPVFSRPFTPAEVDVLNRGLPLELFAGRVEAGKHLVSLTPLGTATAPLIVTLDAKRGGAAYLVAEPGTTGLQWRVE